MTLVTSLSRIGFRAILASTLLGAALVIPEQARAGEAISPAAFWSLDDASQMHVVVSWLIAFQEAVENVDVNTRMEFRNFKLKEDVLDGVESDNGAIVQERFLRTEGSYRLKATVTDRRTGQSHRVDSHYDADSGVSRMLGFTRGHPNGAARIARHQDSYLASYRYGFLLGGAVGEDRVSYVKEILDSANDWTVEKVPDQADLVKLLSLKVLGSGSSLRTEVCMDISRNFSIVRRHERRDLSRRSPDSPERWILSVLDVLEAAPQGEIWYPTKLRYYSTTSRRPDMATVYDLEVGQISFGSVSRADLVVTFPKGAVVNNMMSGATYVEGVPGSALQAGPGAIEGWSLARKSWIIANAVILMALGAWLAIFRMRTRRQSQASGAGHDVEVEERP